MPLTGVALSGACVFGWAVGGDVRALGPIHAARGGATGFVAETPGRARACSAPVR